MVQWLSGATFLSAGHSFEADRNVCSNLRRSFRSSLRRHGILMAEERTRSRSFTGRPRRRHTSPLVRWTDRISRWVIAAGGIGTIVTVSLVCVFLVYVVMPLFGRASIDAHATAFALPAEAKPPVKSVSMSIRASAGPSIQMESCIAFVWRMVRRSASRTRSRGPAAINGEDDCLVVRGGFRELRLRISGRQSAKR